jgi:DNA-binding transcriptional LysR family regulator
MNLNLMRALAVLVEERSVSRAAARLGVTQSAASHILRQLRENLGDALLVRGPSGMVPTPRAEEIASRVRVALDELERAVTAVMPFDPTTATRTFTVAAGDHVAGILLQAIVWRGLREGPGLSVRVVPFDPRQLPSRLERGEIDLAVGHPIADRLDLRQQTLFTDRLVCIVRQGHAEVRGCVTVEQLKRLPHVVLTRDDTTLRQVEDALQRLQIRRHVAVELPYFLLAPSLIPFSDLLLIAPYTLGALFAQGYPLDVLELPIQLPEMRVNTYWHERFEADPAHAWLRGQVALCVKEFFARTSIKGDVLVGSWPEIPPEHRA